METTLEVRWFIKGTPSAAIRHWFEYKCLGELLDEPETREDLYAYQNQLRKLKGLLPQIVDNESVNLKLRQGNLELKLRQAQLGTYQFKNAQGYPIWVGNIEQWSKFSQAQLTQSGLLTKDLPAQTEWLRVAKTRSQKVYQNVKSELTYLQVQGDIWWSVAWEMPQDDGKLNEQHFIQIIKQAAQNYPGLKLKADLSYSYSRWVDRWTMNKLKP